MKRALSSVLGFLSLLTHILAADPADAAIKNAVETDRLRESARSGLPSGAVDPGQPKRGGVYTPPAGSPERVALMDTLRPTISATLRQPVIFVVDHLRVQGDWAFFHGKPRRPNGGKIDYAKTKYREEFKAGMFEDIVYALFQRADRGWRVVTWGIGNTDVPWGGFWKEYRAPKAIFDYADP